MTTEAVNALYRYFATLYSLNQNLIVLCGTDVIDCKGQQEDRIDDVIMSIPRLIPYGFHKKSGRHKIEPSDGVMQLSSDIPFLYTDYESILQKHNVFLEKTRKVRNKLEHKMHGARVVASSSGTLSLFSISYKVADEVIDIRAAEIIAFVTDMNALFSKVQKLVEAFAYENKRDDHPYYRRLVRYDFFDFNKIFESNLLRVIGKALLPF